MTSDAATAGEIPAPETPSTKPPSRFSQWFSLARLEQFLWSRQPKLIPSITVMFAVPILLGLGTWQIARLHQKNELLATMKTTLAGAPADFRLHAPTNPADWRALHLKPVTVQGQWLNVTQFKLAPRTYEGQAGYQLIWPLRLQDNQVVLVDRGFVPTDQDILPDHEGKTVAITGVARVMETRKPFGMPANDPGRGQWTWADMDAMGKQTGFANVAPILLYEARETGRDSFPIGGQLPLPQNNSHWHYAATWYALALILTGVYVMSMSLNADKKKSADENNQNKSSTIDPVAQRGLYPEATD